LTPAGVAIVMLDPPVSAEAATLTDILGSLKATLVNVETNCPPAKLIAVAPGCSAVKINPLMERVSPPAWAAIERPTGEP
jgi:hypothetical protein